MGNLTLAFPPILPTIEKLVCKEILESNKTEDEVAKKVCNMTRSKVKFLPEAVCEKAVDRVWNDAEQKCANLTLAIPPILPTIEKLVCKEILESNKTEDEVAKKVCNETRSKVKFLPEVVCEKAVDRVWNDAKNKCTNKTLAFPSDSVIMV